MIVAVNSAVVQSDKPDSLFTHLSTDCDGLFTFGPVDFPSGSQLLPFPNFDRSASALHYSATAHHCDQALQHCILDSSSTLSIFILVSPFHHLTAQNGLFSPTRRFHLESLLCHLDPSKR
jgi:hypothetical protein